MRIVIVFALIATGIEGSGNIPWLRCSPTMWTLCVPAKQSDKYTVKIAYGSRMRDEIAKETKTSLDVSRLQLPGSFISDGSPSFYWQKKIVRRSNLELTSYVSSAGMQGAKLLQLVGQRLKNHLKITIEDLVGKIGEASTLNMRPNFVQAVDKTVEAFKIQARMAVSQVTSGLLSLAENVLIKTFGSDPDFTDLKNDAALVMRSAVKGISDILAAAIDAVVEQVATFGNIAKDHAATILAALQQSAPDRGFNITMNVTRLVDNGSSAVQQNVEALNGIENAVGAIAAATVENGKDSASVAIGAPKESDEN